MRARGDLVVMVGWWLVDISTLWTHFEEELAGEYVEGAVLTSGAFDGSVALDVGGGVCGS
jgi:uncharacterized membrane protein